MLVTGAGGSIGSELCRQIIRCEPAELVLVGHGENSIFEIYNELQGAEGRDRGAREQVAREQGRRITYHAVTQHVSRPSSPTSASLNASGRVFEAHRPEIVFHAGAHKHVPLMESNAVEAITNNVLGTRNVVEAAVATGVERFVMISTDKAVNPTSVMGASKRVAEMMVHAGGAAERAGLCRRCGSATCWAAGAAWCRSFSGRSRRAGR